MVRRAAVAILVAILVPFALFGNGQVEPSKQTGKAGSAEVKLTYWGWGPHVTAMNQQVGPAFTKQHPNVKVEGISMGPFELMDKFYVAMVSGQGLPDSAQLIRRLSSRYLISELMVDFTDFVKKEHGGQFLDSLTKDVTAVDGRVLGIALDYGPSVVFYNKDLADKLGVNVSAIKTWDDYLRVGKDVSKRYPDIYVQPLYYPAGSWGSNYWKLWAQSAGANIFDDSGKVIRKNAKMKEVTRFFYELHTQVNVIKAPVNDPSIYDALRSGKLLFWPKNSYESGATAQQAPELKGKISAFPWPLWSADARPLTGNWGGVALVVPKRGPNAAIAAEFMKFFATNEESLASLWFVAAGVPSFGPAREKIPAMKGQETFVKDLIESIVVRQVPQWNFFDWAQTEKILGDALDSMTTGDRTPDQAWDWAEAQLASILGR